MMTCPCCRGETAAMTLERTIGGPLTLDLCRHCDGIWFDAGEQFRLMPDSTLRLIKEVQAHRQERRSDAGTRSCVRAVKSRSPRPTICVATPGSGFTDAPTITASSFDIFG